MAYVPNSGSVVAFQSNPSSLLVGASIIGAVPVNGNVFVAGSVAGIINTINSSIAVNLQSTNASIITVGGGTTGNSSVTAYQGGAWSTSVTGGYVNVIGSVLAVGSITALQGTNPWIIGNSSVTTIQGTTPWVVGSVITTAQGSVATAIINISASIATNLQSSNASVIVTGNMNASVLALQGTLPWVIQSVVGTYAEDSAHTSGSSGLFMLGVRNDTMSSVTSTDLDYSPWTTGPVGEGIVANSPITAWVQANTSMMANVSVQALAAQGASVFTYVTGVQVTNVSPNNVYLTFTGGLGGKSSVLGYAPAPANGGAVFTLPNAWKTGQNSGVSASVSGVASIFISLQGFTAKI